MTKVPVFEDFNIEDKEDDIDMEDKQDIKARKFQQELSKVGTSSELELDKSFNEITEEQEKLKEEDLQEIMARKFQQELSKVGTSSELELDKSLNELNREQKEIENRRLFSYLEAWKKLLKQYIIFRLILFVLLLILLICESFAIFAMVALSSFDLLPIEQGTLKILVGATLAQISIMIIYIIKSVFPSSLVDIMGKIPKT